MLATMTGRNHVRGRIILLASWTSTPGGTPAVTSGPDS
jgi:hypothetical protein